MEKGESLTDRTRRCGHDIFTIIQVRSFDLMLNPAAVMKASTMP
jgi:hypothetical protein